MNATDRPLVLHVVYRFDTGGLENGVVNLINRMAPDRFRHAVLALTEVAPSFAARIRRDDVVFHALNKPPGHALGLYPRIWRLLRQMRPAVVHTRNLAALETQPLAALAGVPARLHGEHGRDVEDLDGSDRRLQRVRRLYSPFVHRYTTVSRELQSYLVDRVGVAPRRVAHICNGVDTDRFRPAAAGEAAPTGWPFERGRHCVIGTVGRMQTVKNQTLLAKAFIQLVQQQPALAERARLVMVGDGPLREQVRSMLQEAGLAELAWLPGERSDVPELMRALDCFVLPSLAEGISNTILEAMASGVPVVATDVGGNAELVRVGLSGELVPSGDAAALSSALAALLAAPPRQRAMAQHARSLAEERFSLDAMVSAYQRLYEEQLGARRDHGPTR